ncbi:MAG: Flp family type IVb pilin [Rhodocyclaceae bacterium]|nr:Flp family type IVb pilin [Rhodocyclaceae bacterium]
MNHAVRKLHRQSGVTMIEYALIAALIAVVALTTLTAVGGSVNTKFSSVSTALQ